MIPNYIPQLYIIQCDSTSERYLSGKYLEIIVTARSAKLSKQIEQSIRRWIQGSYVNNGYRRNSPEVRFAHLFPSTCPSLSFFNHTVIWLFCDRL